MNKNTINRLISSRKSGKYKKINGNIAWGFAHIHKRIPENIVKMANNDPYGDGLNEYMSEVEMEIANFLTLGRRKDWPEDYKQYVADTMRWKAWHMIKGVKGGRRKTRRRAR